jgi:hypothetical protein
MTEIEEKLIRIDRTSMHIKTMLIEELQRAFKELNNLYSSFILSIPYIGLISCTSGLLSIGCWVLLMVRILISHSIYKGRISEQFIKKYNETIDFNITDIQSAYLKTVEFARDVYLPITKIYNIAMNKLVIGDIVISIALMFIMVQDYINAGVFRWTWFYAIFALLVITTHLRVLYIRNTSYYQLSIKAYAIVYMLFADSLINDTVGVTIVAKETYKINLDKGN